MGKLSVFQIALHLALIFAILGVVCGLFYPIVGNLIDAGIYPKWPLWEEVNGEGRRIWIQVVFGLKWLWALIVFLLKWLWALIWIPWVSSMTAPEIVPMVPGSCFSKIRMAM